MRECAASGAEHYNNGHAGFLLFVAPADDGLVEIFIEGGSFYGIGAGGDDNDGDKRGVLDNRFKRWGDAVEVRLLAEFLVREKSQHILEIFFPASLYQVFRGNSPACKESL